MNLNSKERVLAEFKETPTRVMNAIAKEGMFHINPRGEGCCKLHICAAALRCAVKQISAGDCDTDFSPNAEWQCPRCLTMNGETPDEDGECETCGSALPPILLPEQAEVEASVAQRTAANPADTTTCTLEQ